MRANSIISRLKFALAADVPYDTHRNRNSDENVCIHYEPFSANECGLMVFETRWNASFSVIGGFDFDRFYRFAQMCWCFKQKSLAGIGFRFHDLMIVEWLPKWWKAIVKRSKMMRANTFRVDPTHAQSTGPLNPTHIRNLQLSSSPLWTPHLTASWRVNKTSHSMKCDSSS